MFLQLLTLDQSDGIIGEEQLYYHWENLDRLQCLLSISLRLYLEWIQWKSMILVAMDSLTLWDTSMLFLLLRVE